MAAIYVINQVWGTMSSNKNNIYKRYLQLNSINHCPKPESLKLTFSFQVFTLVNIADHFDYLKRAVIIGKQEPMEVN